MYNTRINFLLREARAGIFEEFWSEESIRYNTRINFLLGEARAGILEEFWSEKSFEFKVFNKTFLIPISPLPLNKNYILLLHFRKPVKIEFQIQENLHCALFAFACIFTNRSNFADAMPASLDHHNHLCNSTLLHR